jgi:hypothetical protein
MRRLNASPDDENSQTEKNINAAIRGKVVYAAPTELIRCAICRKVLLCYRTYRQDVAEQFTVIALEKPITILMPGTMKLFCLNRQPSRPIAISD